ncbi:hypothetical protein AVEN_7948-1 [Araneus ventricosus]|uniref:Uncharacterized protein n=1 Tax=Araneus ventricosus TaxID=182803 RepID=A0A4Y2D406_ARAVE|nr:hypothetical protein AVEN_7948-1 [Araneus ventricosus]
MPVSTGQQKAEQLFAVSWESNSTEEMNGSFHTRQTVFCRPVDFIHVIQNTLPLSSSARTWAGMGGAGIRHDTHPEEVRAVAGNSFFFFTLNHTPYKLGKNPATLATIALRTAKLDSTSKSEGGYAGSNWSLERKSVVYRHSET